MQQRRHQGLPIGPQPTVPRMVPGAVSDSRGFGRAYSGFAQPDQIALETVRRNVANGVAPFASVIDELTAHNLPPQFAQATFLAIIPSVGVPGAQLLIPKNSRRRQSFIVSNFLGRNNVLFSFDKPIDIGTTNHTGAGIPMGNYYQETNGAVSINDIWVFCNDPGESYPFYMLGYEGGMAPGSNQL
jgi:hypothetical protein